MRQLADRDLLPRRPSSRPHGSGERIRDIERRRPKYFGRSTSP